jgi:hypothetical protein
MLENCTSKQTYQILIQVMFSNKIIKHKKKNNILFILKNSTPISQEVVNGADHSPLF